MTKHLIVPVISEVSLTGENNYFTILNTSGIGLYPDRDLYVVNMWADGMSEVLNNISFDDDPMEIFLIHENFIWVSDPRIHGYKYTDNPCVTGCGPGYTSSKATEIATVLNRLFNNKYNQTYMFDNLIKNMLMEKEKWTNILVESRTLNEIIYEQVLVDKMIVVSIRNIGDDISISIVVGLQNTNPVRINSSMSKIPLKGNLHKINGILFDLMEFSQHAVSSEFDFNYVKMNISKKYLYL